MSRQMPSILLPLLLLCAVSCSGSGDTDSGYSFRRYEEEGITIAETRNGPRLAAPIFKAEEVSRVREEESVPGSLLSNPHWMGIDEAGAIYVLDGTQPFQEVRLVVYDPDGGFSHVIGRMGQGPGEYSYPTITDIRDGIVTMWNPPQRISFFSTGGQLRNLLTIEPGHQGLAELVHVLRDEGLLMISRLTSGGYPDPVTRSAYRAVALSASRDTVGSVETPYVESAQVMMVSSPGGGQMYFSTPALYIPQAVLKYHPKLGIMVTTGKTSEIQWFRPYGSLHLEYRLGLDPLEVTAEDRAVVDRYMTDFYLGRGETALEYLRVWRRDADFPETRAFWKDVQIEENGYLWLEDAGTQFHPTERLFRVVSPAGEYLGNCFLPKGVGWISRGHYLLIDEDFSAGTQDLIVYRIRAVVTGIDYP
ncbi:6-bladed beta-propeller [Gemmatimonadota bacterium]